MTQPRLSEQAQRAVENSFRNDEEAHFLIDAICAEFMTDPRSTQCFDARIVDRVKSCAANRKKYMRDFRP